MAFLFFLLTTLALPSFADFERMQIENLSADYKRPSGRAEIEKIQIDFTSPLSAPYVLTLERTEDAFQVISPFLQLNWLKPWKIIHNAEELSLEEGYASFGKKEHGLKAQGASFSPEGMGAFYLKEILANCSGGSTDLWIENRIIDDCLENSQLTINSLDVPVNFFLNEIVSQYPQDPLPASAKPADSFKLTVKNGDFSFMVYTRVVFYAGLRAWGNVSLQNNRKTLIIRIDQIKFGYFPITAVVMKELAKRNRNPDVIINDNYIMVNLK
jgi:hypothetical protein